MLDDENAVALSAGAVSSLYACCDQLEACTRGSMYCDGLQDIKSRGAPDTQTRLVILPLAHSA